MQHNLDKIKIKEKQRKNRGKTEYKQTNKQTNGCTNGMWWNRADEDEDEDGDESEYERQRGVERGGCACRVRLHKNKNKQEKQKHFAARQSSVFMATCSHTLGKNKTDIIHEIEKKMRRFFPMDITRTHGMAVVRHE